LFWTWAVIKGKLGSEDALRLSCEHIVRIWARRSENEQSRDENPRGDALG
jgi:hypothetical protein